MNDKSGGIEPPDLAQIDKSGWRQGCILPPQLVRGGSLRSGIDPSDLCIVITHDCDLNNRNLQNEPHFEVLLARYLDNEKESGQKSWGKNPRSYQFKQVDELYEISIHDRFIADRSLLVYYEPDIERKVDKTITKQICLWVSKRYYRSAFPNEFNERLRSSSEKIRKILTKSGNNLTGIYLNTVDEELVQGEEYEIIIQATMKPEDFNNPALRAEAQKAFDDLVASIEKCDGITIEDDKLVSESDISIDDLRSLKRWDYDDLSLRSDDWQTIAPLEL
jgi:hypothetical protein